MSMRQNWPEALWLVRHGQSQGNVAREAADEAGLHEIAIDVRDVDVPLSDLGHEQAAATGRWFAALPTDKRPEVILTSPYVRARQTANAICEAGGLTGPTKLVIDERLREREFGVLDRLTKKGILARFPEEAERRRFLGKFFHRPPGGESWADVGLRVRSLLQDLRLDLAGERVLVFSHQVVVLMFRYVLEGLDEATVLRTSDVDPVAHCSVTSFVGGPDGPLLLRRYNEVAPLEQADAPVTTHEDRPGAADDQADEATAATGAPARA